MEWVSDVTYNSYNSYINRGEEVISDNLPTHELLINQKTKILIHLTEKEKRDDKQENLVPVLSETIVMSHNTKRYIEIYNNITVIIFYYGS